MATIHFDQFYGNWLGKADAYNDETLSDVFDKFTSLYVIYNALYMEIVRELTLSGASVAKNFSDKRASTDYVIQYVKSKHLINNLFNDDQSRDKLSEICGIIDREEFHIILDWGKPQRHLDVELLNLLRSRSTQDKAKGILSLFYHVRCNLFHGHKGFEDKQRLLLIPTNYLLRKTVEITYNKLSM